MKGYRTYLTAIGIITHQLLKDRGIDVGEETISQAIDGLLALLTMYFRSKV